MLLCQLPRVLASYTLAAKVHVILYDGTKECMTKPDSYKDNFKYAWTPLVYFLHSFPPKFKRNIAAGDKTTTAPDQRRLDMHHQSPLDVS